MREIKKIQFKTVKAETPEVFDELLNEVLDNASEVEELKLHDTVPYLAYVTYVIYVKEPESIADEYELLGIVKRCGDCPFLQRDKAYHSRQKMLPCQYAKYGKTTIGSRACSVYWENFGEEEICTELAKE